MPAVWRVTLAARIPCRRRPRLSSSQFRRGKRRFDDESTFLKRDRHRRRLPPADFGSETFGLPEGDRWSTWDQSAPTERGPQPHPDWLVADLAAVDTELGILKAVPVLVMHGDDDQVVPYADSGPLSAKLVKNGTLKTYHGFPHGMPTTEAATINADLLAWLQT